MTFGLPPRHPAVLVACLTLAIGYLGLGFEAVGIASMDRPVWSDWSLLAISTAALPPITWLPLRMVARPQDFFQPARTVVATSLVAPPRRMTSLAFMLMMRAGRRLAGA